MRARVEARHNEDKDHNEHYVVDDDSGEDLGGPFHSFDEANTMADKLNGVKEVKNS
jgi:hypothetical protein